ncbi:hypothetical protein ABT297_30805 [Dactylosporangium sp. NPDC000555]|uniref:antibiotic biosynthesis monooxygenase family protein n=1 Tax=Dactylosporangium sp. NPDC000555 TaxID=3154260 RepID=UPI003328D756
MESAQFCTVLEHRVDGTGTQRSLVDALAGVHERWLAHRAGYVSGEFFASLDGRQMLSVVRWESEADFAAFEASSDHPAVMADIQQELERLPGLTDTRVSRFRVLRRVEAAAP